MRWKETPTDYEWKSKFAFTRTKTSFGFYVWLEFYEEKCVKSPSAKGNMFISRPSGTNYDIKDLPDNHPAKRF